MFTSAEKARNVNVHRRQQRPDSTFFRKAGEESFFGTAENQSFFSPVIQAKLSVSSPDDPQEREADAVAEQVMRMPESVASPKEEQDKELQRKEADEKNGDEDSATPSVALQTKCGSCEGEERPQAKLFRMIQRSEADSPAFADDVFDETPAEYNINRKALSLFHSDVIRCSGRGPPAGNIQETFEQRLSSSKGGGSALPSNTKDFMESRFNADFSGVRIHTDRDAEHLSSGINAQAFTHGNDIYFNSGKFSPNTGDGGVLLAHELTHTIQQGASTAVPSAISPKIVDRKHDIQRRAASVPSQLTHAVEKAKTVEGKIDANKPQADGFRTGWEHLVEIFKTTFGEDKIIKSGGSASDKGAVAERDIKKKRLQEGVAVVDTTTSTDRHAIPTTTTGSRDAMPSWCGIFVFWALNKSGVPMPKWKLGERMIKPETARLPGMTPMPGDIAYRNAFSHFAIVESVNGNLVRTVNGNTAGEDNLGGQVQTLEHPLSDWTAFFNPLLIMEGSLGQGETTVEEKPKSLRELRKELFNINRKENAGIAKDRQEAGEIKIDTSRSPDQPSTSCKGDTDSIQPKTESEELTKNEEEYKEEEKKVSPKLFTIHKQTGTGSSPKHKYIGADQTVSSAPNWVQRNEMTGSDANGRTIENNFISPVSDFSNRGPPVQVRNNGNIIQCGWFDRALSFVDSAIDYVTEGLEAGKRLLLREAQDFVMAIPGYRALRVVLGSDPVTGEEIARNGRNFIEAALDIMPGGRLLHQKLNELGALDEAAQWIDSGIAEVEDIVKGVIQRVESFWNGITLERLATPTQIFEEAGNIIHDTIGRIVDFAESAAVELLEIVKRWLLTQLVGFIRERTDAYPLLCVILGQDPITEEAVERNGTTVLSAILELGGEEGREQRTQMQETGTFRKAVAWVDRGISVFGNLLRTVRDNIGLIWSIVSIDALMHPVEKFTEIKNTFGAPVQEVLQFMRDVAVVILRFIKEALLQRLSAWARRTRGYPLVTVIIGKDPFTDELVPFTMENVIRGFFSLMEGGEEQYNQLKESGAIDRTVAKITAAVERLNMTPAMIVQLFIGLWNSFSIRDLADPIGCFRRIVARFGEPIGRLIAFVIEIVKIVIEAILVVMNFPFDLVGNIINRAMAAFEKIKRDPVGFLKNLLRAIKQGFIQFFDNILEHLIQGLVGWLMSELRDAGVPQLTDLSLRGVIGWVLEVLGISMEKIWEKLAAHPRIGPERVARIRSMISRLDGIWTFIRDVQERGMATIWDRIQEQLSNLWNTILDAVKNWVMEQIIRRITVKLLSMLDPTGIMAVVNSAIAIYNAIQSFIKYMREMLEIVNSFVNGVADIAEGNVKTAADYLERTMARAMPIVIGFLANQVGLSGIGRRVGEMIERAREMVDQALTWLVNKAVDTGMNLLDRVMGKGGDAADPLVAVRQDLHRQESTYLTHGAIRQDEANTVAQNVARQNNSVVSAIQVVDGGIKWNYNIIQRAEEEGPRKEEGPVIPNMTVTPSFSSSRTSGVMIVRNLYNDPGNHPNGTATTGRESLDGAFEAIQSAGLSAYWSRGHILNKDFGGMAVTSNLIPIDQSTNLRQVAFDNLIRTSYNTKDAPIYISFNIQRYSDDDKFVSSYSGNAKKMKLSGSSWTETGGDEIASFNSGSINKPGSGLKRSIKSLDQTSATAQYREVGRANNLSVTLLQHIVASGQIMNNVNDLKSFINANYTGIRLQRYMNRVNAAESAGMLDFS